MDEDRYNDTISISKEESILKAVEILSSTYPDASDEELVRPDINIVKVMFSAVFCIIFSVSLFVSAYFIGTLTDFPLWLCYILSVLIIISGLMINLRKIIRTSILIYQKYAPERVRRACVFHPTCSEYMLLAIDKYGTIRGVIKGIDRLSRCHFPNCGDDYP